MEGGEDMSNLSMKENLDSKQLAIAQSEFDTHKKSVAVAYILWFFFGGLGIHRFYIGSTTPAIIMLILFILGWATTFIIIGFVILPALYIWVLIDAFILYSEVNRINLELERKILQKVAK